MPQPKDNSVLAVMNDKGQSPRAMDPRGNKRRRTLQLSYLPAVLLTHRTSHQPGTFETYHIFQKSEEVSEAPALTSSWVELWRACQTGLSV